MQRAALLQGASAVFLGGDAGCWLPAASSSPVCEALCLLRSSKVFRFHVFIFIFFFPLAAKDKPQMHGGICLSF